MELERWSEALRPNTPILRYSNTPSSSRCSEQPAEDAFLNTLPRMDDGVINLHVHPFILPPFLHLPASEHWNIPRLPPPLGNFQHTAATAKTAPVLPYGYDVRVNHPNRKISLPSLPFWPLGLQLLGPKRFRVLVQQSVE